MKAKILFIDDDPHYLKEFGDLFSMEFDVIKKSDGVTALRAIDKGQYDLIIIDVHLPIWNGFELAEKIKKHQNYNNCPLFFLSSDNEHVTRMQGLSQEADDFLSKDMAKEEIEIRVRNQIKKFQSKIDGQDNPLNFYGISLDLSKMIVKIDNLKINFTVIEYKILYFLIRNQKCSVSREELGEFAWPDDIVMPTTINTHISNLRNKLRLYGYNIQNNNSDKLSLVYEPNAPKPE